MRNLTLTYCLWFFLLSSVLSSSAQSRSQLFEESTTVTYIGIDFSHARFIDDEKMTFEPQVFLPLTQRINNLIVTEYEKYDIGKAIKKEVQLKIDITAKINEKINTQNILVKTPEENDHLTTAEISKIVAQYDLTGINTTVGMVFIVDLMSKPDENASIWATFFDIKSKSVLLTEKMDGAAGGFGLRNYWARPFAEIINQIKNKQLKKWKANESTENEPKSKSKKSK